MLRSLVGSEMCIRDSGLHNVKVKLHPEVVVGIQINVARSEDEAARQAKGEDVIATAMAAEKADLEEANAERAANAVSMFEGDAPEEFLEGDGSGADETSAEETPAAPSEEE